MTRVELNIRLDVRGQLSTPEDIAKREMLALSLLGTCAHHRSDFLEQGALMPRLVAGINGEDWDIARFHDLAKQLHQDCIARLNVDTGIGELVGPSVATYGDFDITKFQRLDEQRAG